jgi:hypothetical protein
VPAQRRNGNSEPPSDTPPPGDDLSHRDAFFLEELSYRGHLSSDELIALGVSHGLTATEANDWINDAASRGAIEPLELGAGVDTRWRIAL